VEDVLQIIHRSSAFEVCKSGCNVSTLRKKKFLVRTRKLQSKHADGAGQVIHRICCDFKEVCEQSMAKEIILSNIADAKAGNWLYRIFPVSQKNKKKNLFD
jgi:hypothetical protein